MTPKIFARINTWLKRYFLPLFGIHQELVHLSRSLDAYLLANHIRPVPRRDQVRLWDALLKSDPPGVMEVDEDLDLENEIRTAMGLPPRDPDAPPFDPTLTADRYIDVGPREHPKDS